MPTYTPARRPTRSPARRWWAGAVALATLAGVLWRRPVEPPATDDPAPPPIVVPAPSAALEPARTDRIVQRRRLLDDVTVTPRSVCRGAPVTVRATLRHDARDSVVSILGRSGSLAVLQFAHAGRERVPVVARDWRDGMEIRHAHVRVRECGADALKVVVQPIDADRVALRITDPPADARYRWDLGDGTVVETTHPTLAHDFGARAADRPTTTYAVTVAAHLADGATRRGATAVSLANPRWLANRGAHLWLAATAERFVPPADATGTRVASMSVRGDGTAVRLTGATLHGFPCRDLADDLPPVTIDDTALHPTTVGAEGATTVSLRLRPDLWPEPVCRVEVRLTGHTGAGRPTIAMAGLDLDRPATARVVQDPALRAKLRQARTLLGRGQVSAEDLAALAADGRL